MSASPTPLVPSALPGGALRQIIALPDMELHQLLGAVPRSRPLLVLPLAREGPRARFTDRQPSCAALWPGFEVAWRYAAGDAPLPLLDPIGATRSTSEHLCRCHAVGVGPVCLASGRGGAVPGERGALLQHGLVEGRW